MSEGSSHNSVSAVVFLIVSIVFLFVVHVNGWLFQVNHFLQTRKVFLLLYLLLRNLSIFTKLAKTSVVYLGLMKWIYLSLLILLGCRFYICLQTRHQNVSQDLNWKLAIEFFLIIHFRFLKIHTTLFCSLQFHWCQQLPR